MDSTISSDPQKTYHITDFLNAGLLILLQIGVLIGWNVDSSLTQPNFVIFTIGMIIGIIGVGLNLYDPTARDISKKIVFIAGLVILFCIGSFFAENSLINDYSTLLGVGFWLSMVVCILLCIQYLIPSPETLQTTPLVQAIEKSPFNSLFAIISLVLVVLNLAQGVSFMREHANKLTLGVVALGIGIFGVWLIFYFTNELVENLPDNIRYR
ncbi:MAG: hypothetical protein KJ043_15980, partial [Anaerolineae bacterium]|nr:hypothetical protein [Anaerolineae bacterium]